MESFSVYVKLLPNAPQVHPYMYPYDRMTWLVRLARTDQTASSLQEKLEDCTQELKLRGQK